MLPGAGLLVGAGVVAAVYGVKVGAGALFGDRDDQAATRPTPPRPQDGTPAAFWLGRAEHAVAQLADMAQGQQVTATDTATAHAADEARGVLDSMRRLAAQVVAVDQALARTDGADLEREASRLRELADRSPGDDSARRSAEAVADRLAVRNRLRASAAALAGRLQSSALGLEGLVARVAEVRATATAVGELDPTAGDLAALTTEVEGLRQGLVEVERSTQQALGDPA